MLTYNQNQDYYTYDSVSNILLQSTLNSIDNHHRHVFRIMSNGPQKTTIKKRRIVQGYNRPDLHSRRTGSHGGGEGLGRQPAAADAYVFISHLGS